MSPRFQHPDQPDGVDERTSVAEPKSGSDPQYASTTNGFTNQWNFTYHEHATDPNVTNVRLSRFCRPIWAFRAADSERSRAPDTNATRVAGADIDLYVSTDPNLTNLNAATIAAAFNRRPAERKRCSLAIRPPNQCITSAEIRRPGGGGVWFCGCGHLNSSASAMPRERDFDGADPNSAAPIVPGSPSKPGVLSILR